MSFWSYIKKCISAPLYSLTRKKPNTFYQTAQFKENLSAMSLEMFFIFYFPGARVCVLLWTPWTRTAGGSATNVELRHPRQKYSSSRTKALSSYVVFGILSSTTSRQEKKGFHKEVEGVKTDFISLRKEKLWVGQIFSLSFILIFAFSWICELSFDFRTS